MLDSLPYELPELVTSAPLDTHRSTVLPEWVDWNGHMNVAFYVTAFDQASGAFIRNMGLGRRYVDGKLGMTFVLEAHITYDREMREGAPMRFTTQLLERDAKKVHLYQEMFHAEQGYLAATNEVIVMNIDYTTPVVFLYLDRLTRRSRRAGKGEGALRRASDHLPAE